MTLHSKVKVIAEAGVNHNGSLARALELVDVAADCGADIVKFQTFKSEKLVSRNAKKADYQVTNTGSHESQFEMVKKLELSADDHFQLLKRCQHKGIEFMSTPFDVESVTLLAHELGVKHMKVPSGELTNPLLLLAMARTQLPMLVSSGMATLGEIEQALGVIAFGLIHKDKNPKSVQDFKEAFCSDLGQKLLRERVTLFHCTTEYPAPFAEVNLKAMQTMQMAFQLPVGYSDHTMGIHIPVAAVALGATVIEKHFTLDRNLPGPDHKASIEPSELRAMVQQIRDLTVAMGNGVKVPSGSELRNIAVARRSIVAKQGIRTGETFTEQNIEIKRPGNGISPLRYWEFLGRKAQRAYQADELLDE